MATNIAVIDTLVEATAAADKTKGAKIEGLASYQDVVQTSKTLFEAQGAYYEWLGNNTEAAAAKRIAKSFQDDLADPYMMLEF